MIKLLSIPLAAAIAGISWIFLDDLDPVFYVEDIIFLVADLGNIWLVAGIFSLLLLLSPFFFYGKQNIVSFSVGIYFLVTIIVTFLGNFPMPIMGYGISPIIGYILAITLLNKNSMKSEQSYK